MKTLEYDANRMDYYKNSDFPAMEGSGAVEDAMVQPHAEADGKPLEKDANNQEREQQLEAWMVNVKAFIRNIDISKL